MKTTNKKNIPALRPVRSSHRQAHGQTSRVIAIVIFLITVLSFSSCKKCYYCQAKKQGIEEAIDFAKSCGTKNENQKMEDEFRARYPEKDGYTVYCK